jgi:4-hydroxy-4-methyl-2-oxoglutarate aldolase
MGITPYAMPSTCDISDACDELGIAAVRTGALRPAWTGCPAVLGRVVTLTLEPGEGDPLPALLEALAEADGDVALVDLGGRVDVQCWGSVLATAARHHGITAALVNGATRDVAALAELGYPTYARGVVPARIRGRLTFTGAGADVVIAGATMTAGSSAAVEKGGATVTPGSAVAADDSGAVFFPAKEMEAVLDWARAHADEEAAKLARISAGADPREVFVG